MRKGVSPKPRVGFYCFQPIINIINEDGTWLEGEGFSYPKGGKTRRCYAECDDGKRRVVWVGIPDTFFTIPGYYKKNGRRVHGYITSGDRDENTFRFHEYKRKEEEK